MAQQLIPPTNFGVVEDSIFRSGEPHELNFPFLEQLKLKSIIYLSPESPTTHLEHFCVDRSIAFLHLGQSSAGPITSGSGSSVSEETVLEALGIILDQSNYPILICCNLGRHHTGTVVGCLRKLQRWNLTSIFSEYRRHAGSRVRQLNEQFIEFFDVDMVAVPANGPRFVLQLLEGD